MSHSNSSNSKPPRSVSREAEDIRLATEMIKLGARLQVLQSGTQLSYDRLARLYKEIRKVSPPKGMLPFSVDWYMTWLPNIHSSLFYSIYQYLNTHTPSKKAWALIEAYRLYLQQARFADGQGASTDSEAVLSFTRAWMLLRFFESGLMQISTCKQCQGGFIAHAHEPQKHYVCAICKPPPRAGKTRKAKAARDHAESASGKTLALSAHG